MKTRFPILAKVAILGALVTLLSASLTLLVSYFNQVDRAEKMQAEAVDNALDDLLASLTSEEEGLGGFVDELYDYVVPIYEENHEEGEFASFAEKEEHYKSLYKKVYGPTSGSLGMSQDMVIFRGKYSEVLIDLSHAIIASGGENAYLCFLDEARDRFVYLADAKAKSSSGSEYHLVGTYYERSPKDEQSDFDYARHHYYSLGGKDTRYYPVGDSKVLAFIEYDSNAIVAENVRIIVFELIILLSTAILLIGLYVLFAYLIFVRNLHKLTSSTKQFEETLSGKQSLSVRDPNVNSRDEMKTLSESFLSLEKAVIDYVDLIEKETKEKEKINAELSVASKIQLEALPSRSKDEPRFQLEAYIQPAKEVGGDFYDYFFLDPNRLVLIVSDVSGKGIPASLFMMKGKELLKANLLSETSLVKAIEKTNDQLCLNNAENLFITSFVGIIDFTSNTMSYVNAGHEKPYLIRGKEVTRLDGECNFVLGGYPSFPYKEESLALKKGDILFLFTDGLNEAIDEKEEEFGYARIENSLAQSEGKSLSERIKAMEEALSSFAKDQEGFDDVTMLFFLLKEEEGLHLLYQEKDYEIIAKAMKEFELRFASLPADFKSEVGIILDEVINNFVTYEAKKTLCIGIDFTLVNDCLQIVFSNDGDPFDPLKDHEDKYIEAYDDNLALGGFGISLVKNLSSEISYDYVDGKNVLTIKKKL